MKFVLLVWLVTWPLVGVRAQIYADITVEEGDTELGTFRIELAHLRAPRTVANFIGLATGQKAWIDPATGAVRQGVPYFDGLPFHRLIHNFVIQGGDPLGTGAGGPGYVFQDEFDATLRHDGAYVVSMANSGPNSNGSQFFITLAATEHLNDLHSIFGTVINDTTYPNSRALIDGFMSNTSFPTDASNRPVTPLTMKSVVISGPDLAGFDLTDSVLGLPTVVAQLKSLTHRDGQTFLVWDRLDRHDSPVRSSTDLVSWAYAGSLLSMGAETQAEVEVTGLVSASATFFSFPMVDYSNTPSIPANIFDVGDQIVFAIQGGVLTVTFNGAGGGSWVFDDSGGGQQTGSVTNTFIPSNTRLPGIPLSGTFIQNQGTFASALSAREVTIFFDAPIGTQQLTAIQPTLSFHTNTTGWYNGPVNSNLASPGLFRGVFTWIPAP